ncbi:hypothetical protein HCN44_003319 [Aphidius gifuensis]|uniref:Ig-like domain-containing protein n=1 Tax=Aphidius gifuensis TaxID=684658 RepID=A0A835CKT7_APHGI|nr:uncharacterized protein LOC122858998 [Aphidius gifuensis]KAF7987557.1 hypothetical protein HCN44_003319 [Aphidius gifuensis]
MGRLDWINLVVLFAIIAGVRCLRNVTLDVVPELVERGQQATLRCHYILDANELIYSLKWYRGTREFYRYSPSEHPATKKFNITGINVDDKNSNQSQVTITNVDFGLSGNFSCEVTVDEPTFSTEQAIKKITIVSLPSSRPVLASERSRYESGDILKANCSVPPSKPPVEFSFTLNNFPVGQTNARQEKIKSDYYVGSSNSAYMDDYELQLGELSIELKQSHFQNGQLNLRCIAQIPGIYRNVSDTSYLGTGLREPVPERVTLGGRSSTIYGSVLTIFCLCALQMLLR